jgi:hypothetical protein
MKGRATMSMSRSMTSRTRSRTTALAALALVLSGGFAVGCGGDSSGSAADAWTGHWLDADNTTGFTMGCTDATFSQLFPSGTQYQIFGGLTFEKGELTDLTETSGYCNLLNYDIKGNSATVVSPDPYLMDAAACIYSFVATDGTYNYNAAIKLTPNAGWTVKKLSDKSAAGAEQVQLVGTAAADIAIDDGSATGLVSPTGSCSYGGQDTFFRLTKG